MPYTSISIQFVLSLRVCYFVHEFALDKFPLLLTGVTIHKARCRIIELALSLLGLDMLHVVFLAQMVRLKMIVHHFLAFKTLHDIAFILGLLALT